MNEPSLLAAVLANPDNDPARLVFADAIRARDPQRAEFIEVQCELARQLALADDDWDVWRGCILLRSRERALLEENAKRWLAELGVKFASVGTFRRGFVEHLQLYDGLSEGGIFYPEANFRAGSLARATPLRSVICRGDLVGLASGELAQIPRLEHLELCFPALNHGWRELLAMSSLAGLRALSFSAYRGFDEFVAQPFPLRLERLALRDIGGDHGDDVAQRLAAAPACARLHQLRVDGSLTTQGVVALAESPYFPRLATLSFSSETITVAELEPLLRALPSLRELRITGLTRWDPDSFAQLPATGLTALELTGDDRTMIALAASRLATTLRQLTFNHREIHVGRTVARALAGAASLAQLRHLEFSYDHLSPQDLESIASSPRLPELRSITLWGYTTSDVAKRAPQGWTAEGSRLVRERR